MQKHLISWLLLFIAMPVSAYRIEISNPEIAYMPVFWAGYYGDQLALIDSTLADVDGKAVFERDDGLCTGMYTLLVPGKLSFDLLIDDSRQLRIEWLPAGNVRVEGDELAAAWAEYNAWANTRPGREQLIERRRQLIAQYPGTFLAAYLTALQPVETSDTEAAFDMNRLMNAYQYRRRHFFDNMPLSDVRLLRTPIYHETIHFYFTQFVTRQTDSLIHIAYRMLEQAADHYETFFYVSDFLIDFSLRNNEIKDIRKLYDFVSRNRDMLGVKGRAMLPERSRTNYFRLPDERSLQNRLQNMILTGIDGQAFDQQAVHAPYRVYYFWKDGCSRCIADVARWRGVLERSRQRSYLGIAVNVVNDVQLLENRILDSNPLCVNVSAVNIPCYGSLFFVNFYSKLIVTDAEGHIIGMFASAAAWEHFLNIAR